MNKPSLAFTADKPRKSSQKKMALRNLPTERMTEVGDGLVNLELTFESNESFRNFCGVNDVNLCRLEEATGLRITRRGLGIVATGAEVDMLAARPRLLDLRMKSLREAIDSPAIMADAAESSAVWSTWKQAVFPKTPSQEAWGRCMADNNIAFGVGPAGTGKTYLAVAYGVHLLRNRLVDRIILSRPAVEAGERLGFLPGDMKEKVDPYMQPIYDVLQDMIPAKVLEIMLQERKIQIAPLAFMRGRTLARAFVLLDEAQNATAMQMKMFLTRLGEGSTMCITGDQSQIDLPRGTPSGLSDALRILEGKNGIGIHHFNAADQVRHPLVRVVLEAYEARETLE